MKLFHAEPEMPARRWKPGMNVIQYGHPRTASTFQYYLLCSIVALKLPTSYRCNYAEFLTSEVIMQPNSTVFKTHKNPEVIINSDPHFSETTLLFYSAASYERVNPRLTGTIAHTQRYEVMLDCPLAEIQYYVPIFDLSPREQADLQEHLELWSILRVCCGTQQSLDNRLRLHGCPPRRAFHDPANPHCEQYDLNAVERSFANTSINRQVPRFNMQPLGHCALEEAHIKNGAEFFGNRFRPSPENCKKLVHAWSRYDAASTLAKRQHVSRLLTAEPRHIPQQFKTTTDFSP